MITSVYNRGSSKSGSFAAGNMICWDVTIFGICEGNNSCSILFLLVMLKQSSLSHHEDRLQALKKQLVTHGENGNVMMQQICRERMTKNALDAASTNTRLSKKDEPYKAEVIALTEKLITLLPYNTIAIKAS